MHMGMHVDTYTKTFSIALIRRCHFNATHFVALNKDVEKEY